MRCRCRTHRSKRALAPSAWRAGIQVVATGMSTIYLLAVRRMPPHAQLAVDLFHVVRLANKTLGDVRRRATRQKYGRRGKSGDPEYCIGGLDSSATSRTCARARSANSWTRSMPTRMASGSPSPGSPRKNSAISSTCAPVHRHGPGRAGRAGPPVAVLELVRPEPRHSRTGQPRHDD